MKQEDAPGIQRARLVLLALIGLLTLYLIWQSYRINLKSQMFAAISRRDTASVQSLLRQGVNPNIRDGEGRTALLLALMQGEPRMVHALFAAGADVIAEEKKGARVLCSAASYQDRELVQYLLEKGANPNESANSRYGGNALHVVAANGDLAIAEMLLRAGTHPNEPGYNGDTPLITASKNGRLEISQILLRNGADIEAMDEGGRTALSWAVAEKHPENIQWLLAHGAKANVKSIHTDALLIYAIRNEDVETVSLLLRHGADRKAQAPNGQTALRYALDSPNKNLRIIALLKAAEASSH